MTIGIAASGPGAGAAIVAALARAETVCSGAIGGFVSFACLDMAGVLWRTGLQRGGAGALLGAGGLPPHAAAAPRAVLMSSGPDRPEPLAQFTPGAAGVGLVTGHRFPNSRGREGSSLAEEALALMRGEGPAAAAAAVAAAHPAADAGLICLAADGSIGIANTAYVASFPGVGVAERRHGGAGVAVLLNAISPGPSVAALVADLALEAMAQPAAAAERIAFSAGILVRTAQHSAVLVGADSEAREIRLVAPQDRSGVWYGGYGPAAAVLCDGRLVGRMLDEPFLSGAGAVVHRFDGHASYSARFVRRKS